MYFFVKIIEHKKKHLKIKNWTFLTMKIIQYFNEDYTFYFECHDKHSEECNNMYIRDNDISIYRLF